MRCSNGHEMRSDQNFCPVCGSPPAPEPEPSAPSPPPAASPKKVLWKRWWFIGLVVVVAIAVGASLSGGGLDLDSDTTSAAGDGSSTPDDTARENLPPAPPPAEPPPAPPPPVTRFRTFEDGTHIVGEDIRPGTYRTREGASGCYYARLRDFDGDLESIIANENTDDPAVVTILKTDRGFESNDCGTWTSDLSRITRSRSRFGAGTYIVGVDIKPGTYRNSGGEGCYWARLRNFRHTLESIIANDNTDSRTVVRIRSTDKGFESNGCGTWKRL